jgi:kinase
MDFEEFAASAISVYQMEALDAWEQHARRAYELFDKEGNRPIVIEELASVWFQLYTWPFVHDY